MNKPHIHAECIKAWADGAQIQVRDRGAPTRWQDCDSPMWALNSEYRVKPQKKTPGQLLAETYDVVWDKPYTINKDTWENKARRFLEAYKAESAEDER